MKDQESDDRILILWSGLEARLTLVEAGAIYSLMAPIPLDRIPMIIRRIDYGERAEVVLSKDRYTVIPLSAVYECVGKESQEIIYLVYGRSRRVKIFPIWVT